MLEPYRRLFMQKQSVTVTSVHAYTHAAIIIMQLIRIYFGSKHHNIVGSMQYCYECPCLSGH